MFCEMIARVYSFSVKIYLFGCKNLTRQRRFFCLFCLLEFNNSCECDCFLKQTSYQREALCHTSLNKQRLGMNIKVYLTSFVQQTPRWPLTWRCGDLRSTPDRPCCDPAGRKWWWCFHGTKWISLKETLLNEFINKRRGWDQWRGLQPARPHSACWPA